MEYSDLEHYDYLLPEELIRKRGVEPRDSSRLFVYDTATDSVTHDVFANLAGHLPARSVTVLNETRVVPARLLLRKETGGKIEAFVLANEIGKDADDIPILVDRKCVPGMKLLFPDGSHFEIVSQEENRFFVRLRSDRPLSELLDAYGETPIPHYLEDGNEKVKEEKLRKRYQTIFAKTGASVAAPTASLHFTDRVFDTFRDRGIEVVAVGLDVGLGTFAPLKPDHFSTKTLHRERIEMSADAADRLNGAKREGRPIVAVGTTALRTLESVVSLRPNTHPSSSRTRKLLSESEAGNGEETIEPSEDLFRPFGGKTDIFIFPPYHFRSADVLVTNFHLPKSSLMLLVEAFLRDKGSKRSLVSLYEEAIREGYAFYSFGDSMLIR